MTIQPHHLLFRGRRGRIAVSVLWTLALLGFAGSTSAQSSCPQGETLVEFPAGEISPYTVPAGVQALRITAAGAKGGDGLASGVGGLGAVLTGTVSVAADTELRILVGTAGADGISEPGEIGGGGGGGGSFVGVGGTDATAFSSDNLLVVAGGGGGSSGVGSDGGAGGTPNGAPGEGATAGGGGLADGTGGAAGSGSFGIAGEGGGAAENGDNGSSQGAGGGGGAGGDGGNSAFSFGGQAAVHGGEGGAGNGVGGGADGGVGGGGGGEVIGNGAGGGGGGYAGGGGAAFSDGGGGGGSSFFADGVTEPSMAATNEGDGFVFFCEISAPPPAFAKTFEPASVPAGDTSTLTFTIDNGGSELPAEELVFTDTLPSGVVVADPANASTECGGTLTTVAGSTEITFEGGAVEAGATCAIHVDVTSTVPGSHENVSGALTSSLGDSGEAVATLEVSEVAKSFTVETATGTGEATGTINGGGAGCAVSATALAVDDPEALPPGVTLPHGLIALELTGCEDGASVEVTASFPSDVPLGSEYWKFGPTPDEEAPHWYALESAAISGSTVTFTLVDGGAGDGDLTVDGTIVDPGGPAGVPPVPALPRLALVLLLALLAWAAFRTLRRLDRHPPASPVR